MGIQQSLPDSGSSGASSKLGAPFDASLISVGQPFVRSARYARLTAPGGNTVHVLGVVPCSTLSAEEAAALVRTAQPAALYIDASPELVGVLREEVRAGRIGGAQRVPEASPTYRPDLYPGLGPLTTIAVRNFMADNDLAQLLGCEEFAPEKAALAAGAALAEPPAVLSFPLTLTYSYADPVEVGQAQHGRPGHVGLLLSGNSAQFSTQVGAYLGNQTLVLHGRACDVEQAVELPPAGYFTRAEVSAIQARFRAAVNSFAMRCSAETCDVEDALGVREAEARADGDAALAASISAVSLTSQRQSQAIAHELQAAADALPPGGSVVAIVNIGGLASLQRNWSEARPTAEVFPPATLAQQAISTGLGSIAVGGVGYALYRAGRRFPRAVGAFTLLVGGSFAGLAAFGIHSDNVRYGTSVRSALARPRITSSLTRG